jgi:mRNA interferase RelE/StbE
VTRPVVWSRPAERDLSRFDADTARRVLDTVDRFAASGQGDVRRLQGRERQWRLRVGDLRVIFTDDPQDGSIQIVRVLPRGRAYRV